MKKYCSFFLLILPILFNSCSSDDSEPEKNSEKLLRTFRDNDRNVLAKMDYDSKGNLISYIIGNGTRGDLIIKYDWENGFPKQITAIYSESNDTTIFIFDYFTTTKARATRQELGDGPNHRAILDYTFSDGLLKSLIESDVDGRVYSEEYFSHDAKGNLTNIKRVSNPFLSGGNVSTLVVTEWDEGKKPLHHFGTYLTFSNWDIFPIGAIEWTNNNIISYTITYSNNDKKSIINEFEYDSDGYVTSINSPQNGKWDLTYY